MGMILDLPSALETSKNADIIVVALGEMKS
jgi:hypothetical protein